MLRWRATKPPERVSSSVRCTLERYKEPINASFAFTVSFETRLWSVNSKQLSRPGWQCFSMRWKLRLKLQSVEEPYCSCMHCNRCYRCCEANVIDLSKKLRRSCRLPNSCFPLCYLSVTSPVAAVRTSRVLRVADADGRCNQPLCFENIMPMLLPFTCILIMHK